jgi:hypothetical protein
MATDSTGNVFQQLATTDATDLTSQAPPPPNVVDFLHALADTTRPEGVHHALGTDVTNATPGNHQHNGLDSYQLLYGTGVTLPADLVGTPTSAQIVASVNALNAIMRTYLGSA